MIGISSSSQTDSSVRPNPGTVALGRNHLRAIIRTPDESPKTAVVALLTGGNAVSSELLRKAQLAAREHSGIFYVALSDSSRQLGKAQVRTLIENAVLASYLGARIVWLESSDVVGALLKFARQSRVGRIFVSRNRPAPFYRQFGRTAYSDLLRRGDGLRIDVVGF